MSKEKVSLSPVVLYPEDLAPSQVEQFGAMVATAEIVSKDAASLRPVHVYGYDPDRLPDIGSHERLEHEHLEEYAAFREEVVRRASNKLKAQGQPGILQDRHEWRRVPQRGLFLVLPYFARYFPNRVEYLAGIHQLGENAQPEVYTTKTKGEMFESLTGNSRMSLTRTVTTTVGNIGPSITDIFSKLGSRNSTVPVARRVAITNQPEIEVAIEDAKNHAAEEYKAASEEWEKHRPAEDDVDGFLNYPHPPNPNQHLPQQRELAAKFVMPQAWRDRLT